jgi:hypothetical protein
MPDAWQCAKCKRLFSRRNQRHACGTGDRATVLRNRKPELVELYGALERFVKKRSSLLRHAYEDSLS